MSAEPPVERSRIELLSDALADQIAAGEVVERPASVVKELVENSIDAGARRVELHLEEGGRKLISVVDDGHGIEPGELELALTRHATSKLKRADQLIELLTLGFRGEALASIAAVARITLRSRRPDSAGGTELRSVPGEGRERRPCAMAPGTQVRVEELFAALPARRKFLRAEATEVGHCVEAVLRAALVHPEVHFVVTHGKRQLLGLPAGSLDERVQQVLGRRAQGPYFSFEDERDGVKLRAWLASPEQASRQRGGFFVVVRRRVVSERSLQNIVNKSYGDALPSGRHPVACVIVEPAHGSVDVNVHPQKSEVRFSEPQRVYGAVREMLAEHLTEAPWAMPMHSDPAAAFESAPDGAASALDRWERHRPSEPVGRSYTAPRTGGGGGGGGYRLGTRALRQDYASLKQGARDEAQQLQSRLSAQRAEPDRAWLEAAAPLEASETPRSDEPRYLTVLPDGVALFSYREALWAVSLRRLRTFLLTRRLHAEFGGGGIQAQGLLPPLTVPMSVEEVGLVACSKETLASVGVDAEGFGNDAVIVRAVPAALDDCRDVESVTALLHRLVPWLRMRANTDSRDTSGVEALADTGSRAVSVEVAARYARRWLKQALVHEPLEKLPGVQRWDAGQLLRE